MAPCAHFDLPHCGPLVCYEVVIHGFQIELDGLSYVREGFFDGLTFADTAGKRWDIDGKAALVARLQDDFQTHITSFAMPCHAAIRGGMMLLRRHAGLLDQYTRDTRR